MLARPIAEPPTKFSGRYSPSTMQEYNNDSSTVSRMISSQYSHGTPPSDTDYFPETDTEDTPSDKMFADNKYYLNDISRLSQNSNESTDSAYPVSGFSNGMVDNRAITQHAHQAFKCRQLPCRTYISTGSCPYGDRCVFLHDPALTSKPVYIKTKRKSKEDVTTDAFFWPTMSLNAVMSRTDSKNLPHISQSYVVPPAGNYLQANGNNDLAVFSMWEHFLDFCKSDPLSIVAVPRKIPALNPFTTINPYTGKKRLSVLIRLSQSQSAV